MSLSLIGILERIEKIMPGEYRQDLLFRGLIAASEASDPISHLTHDPVFNPPARAFAKQGEPLAHGQDIIQRLAVVEAYSKGLTIDAVRHALKSRKKPHDGDLLMLLKEAAEGHAGTISLEEAALYSFASAGTFTDYLLKKKFSRAADRRLAGTYVFDAFAYSCKRELNPADAIEVALKNWEDYDWKRRQASEKNVEGVLNGLAVCGQGSGPAHVLTKNLEAELKAGNVPTGAILILPHSKSDIIFVMNKVAGVVTDEGGSSCHAAINCRGFNKPCVVGTGNATEKIKTGYDVYVDGTSGRVTYSPPKK